MQGFSTERLNVTNWADALARPERRAEIERDLTAILTEPVLRHLPEPLALADKPDAVAAWVSDRAAESDVFLIEEKGSGDLIGLLLVAPGEVAVSGDDQHLGYLLAENAWGKGYATELVQGLVDALSAFKTARLMGGVGTDNPASAHVLKKCGFTRSDEMSTRETEIYVRQLG